MPRKSYTQTRYAIFQAMLPEHCGRLLRFLRLVLKSLAILLAFAVLFGAAASGSSKGLGELLASGLFLLLDIVPDPGGAAESDILLATVARILGLIMTGLFAGFSVNTLSEPVNVIDFARYAVIDPLRNELRVRYWIRQPEGRYLHNVRIDVSIMDRSERNRGETSAVQLFRYCEPKDTPGIPYGEYGFARGVRFVDMDLELRSSCSSGETLQNALAQMGQGSAGEVLLSVSIIGTSADGRLITRRKVYKSSDVLFGYDFLSIRRDEVDSEWEQAMSASLDEADVAYFHRDYEFGRVPVEESGFSLFHEHFDVVYAVSCEDAVVDSQAEGCGELRVFKSKPSPLYVFAPGEVAGRLYIPYRVFRELCASARKKIERIGRF